jgi:acetylornithine deacetylase/succinyl-diaminopimelate desuccinylase-like protein
MFPTKAVAPDKIVSDLLASQRVRRAFARFAERADEITREQAAICEIPAPPFGEEARAEYLSARFRQCGLRDTTIDTEGNCVALRRGANLRPLLVISAHLDTVFPAGTNFTVRREGARLYAPGIADDGCGLVALLALLDALEEAAIETEGSILFVGTVGEEGEGNLRGARHLLTTGEWAREIDAFISLDGPGIEGITHRAVGSRRYRVRCAGAGGHSWGDFGVPNPVHTLGRAIARLISYPAPARPRTTFNVGRVEGGAGVNCIAQEAMMDVDLRSESPDELKRLDAYFRRAAREAVEEENASRRANTPPLELEMKLIGDRPGGETPKDAPLVRLAEAATRALGFAPRFDCSSTDANIAISLGVPAITVGAGGLSANAHTLDEWYDPRGRELALNRALLLMLGTVGMRSA